MSIRRDYVIEIIDILVDSLSRKDAIDALKKLSISDNPLAPQIKSKIHMKFNISKLDDSDDSDSDSEVDLNTFISMISSNWKPSMINKLLDTLIECCDSTWTPYFRLALTRVVESKHLADDNDITNLMIKFIPKGYEDILYSLIDKDIPDIFKHYLRWRVENTLPNCNMFDPIISSISCFDMWEMESYQQFFELLCQEQVGLKAAIRNISKKIQILPNYLVNL